jgi:hypothetical protein
MSGSISFRLQVNDGWIAKQHCEEVVLINVAFQRNAVVFVVGGLVSRLDINIFDFLQGELAQRYSRFPNVD